MTGNPPAWMRAAALLVSAACLTGAAREPPRRIDACALLREDEIRRFLGREVHPGERHDEGEVAADGESGGPSYSSTCLWRVKAAGEAPPDPRASVAGTDFVIVSAIRWPAGEGARTYLQSFRDAARDGTIDGDPIPVEIGDEALWWGDGVALRKAESGVGVSVRLIGDREKERLVEEELAKLISHRL